MPTADEWMLLLREADQKLADERALHQRDLRAADQRAVELLQSGADKIVPYLIAAAGVIIGVVSLIVAFGV